ncbi:hypothetical protein [Gordonia rhizosphera]|uniref:Smu12A n=1 Tax=Gordonia rhizosphera NBRC 16068 TaxID=1108045 RepID=K6WJK7_9ACTN|nr:hypothetical protein [Gordonia rhizosphera]GAB93971.1 hypothetical protein GORHZ_249_00070 [Gordonia rhizosphera NBRC 16068]
MAETETSIAGWLAGRLPDDLFTGAPEVRVDREEITVIGTIDPPTVDDPADEAAVREAEAGRISRFRESTRERRMAVAREAEHRFDRKVAWGVRCGESSQLFTHLAVPVMTRLRQPQRQVLDTLVAAGVARSRADALAWCVKLVGQHADSWLSELRDAMSRVDEIRDGGPTLD